MKAAELNGTHIGKRVSVEGRTTDAAGTLGEVTHKADVIVDQVVFGRTDYSVGMQQVVLKFLNGSTLITEPGADVALLDK